jgi:Heliorhodopsin
MATRSPLVINEETSQRLKSLNRNAGILHLISGVAILSLSNGFSLPVIGSYITGAPGTSGYQTVVLFHTPVALLCALFMFLSAAAHLWIISKPGFARYLHDLQNQRNYARWVEYSVSSSLMVLLISQLNSVRDIGELFAIVVVNASMILFGWLQEKYEVPGEGGLMPFYFGCLAGITPWAIFTFLLISPKGSQATNAPGFVYGIVVSLFIFFNCFALNQWLQYKKFGKWKDYLYGERVYILLSFVAKSALAWQIFAGALASGTGK